MDSYLKLTEVSTAAPCRPTIAHLLLEHKHLLIVLARNHVTRETDSCTI